MMHNVAFAAILWFKAKFGIFGPLDQRWVDCVDASLEQGCIRQNALMNSFGNHDLHVGHDVSLVGSIIVDSNPLPRYGIDPLEHCSASIVLYRPANNRS